MQYNMMVPPPAPSGNDEWLNALISWLSTSNAPAAAAGVPEGTGYDPATNSAVSPNYAAMNPYSSTMAGSQGLMAMANQNAPKVGGGSY